jgi:HSP20 family molecular chaperone IbpA
MSQPDTHKGGSSMSPSTAMESPLTRSRDVWPRFTDWLDTLVPSDMSWRTGFPHSIRVEEFSKNGDFVIRAELPGIDPDKDVQINVRDNMLTIQGKREEHMESDHRSEFFYGRFMRTLTLPSGADEKHIKASYRDGILEVYIPMREPSEKAHTIPIARKD